MVFFIDIWSPMNSILSTFAVAYLFFFVVIGLLNLIKKIPFA